MVVLWQAKQKFAQNVIVKKIFFCFRKEKSQKTVGLPGVGLVSKCIGINDIMRITSNIESVTIQAAKNFVSEMRERYLSI